MNKLIGFIVTGVGTTVTMLGFLFAVDGVTRITDKIKDNARRK